MSKLGISTGTLANDGTGDSLLQGGVKINSNFSEIYNSIGDGTNINIGVGKTLITTVLSSGNVGIGSTIPTSKLDILGNAKFSGIITSTTFSGQISSGVGTITNLVGTSGTITNLVGTSGSVTNLVGTSATITNLLGTSGTVTNLVGTSATITNLVGTSGTVTNGIITNLVGTSGTITNLVGTSGTIPNLVGTSGTITNLAGTTLQYTGVVTFTNGPVFIGTATSTGTANQDLQVNGGVYVSGQLGIGTTRPITGTANTGIHIDEGQLRVTGTSGLNIGIFSGSTTNDLIRITQLGTGNALVVEDSINPDPTHFVVGAAGSVGIATSNPKALLHIGAGGPSGSSSPLKFSSGTNLTIVESGTFEYDGSTFFVSPNSNYGRATILSGNYTSGIGSTLSPTATGETTSRELFSFTNGTINLSEGTYYLQLVFLITRGNTSTTSATARINFVGGGSAVGTFSGKAISSVAAGGATSMFMFNGVGITSDNVVTAANAAAGGVYNIEMSGILKITTGGTFTPKYSLSANLTGATSATTVSAPNYMTLQILDTQSSVAFGPSGCGWT